MTSTPTCSSRMSAAGANGRVRKAIWAQYSLRCDRVVQRSPYKPRTSRRAASQSRRAETPAILPPEHVSHVGGDSEATARNASASYDAVQFPTSEAQRDAYTHQVPQRLRGVEARLGAERLLHLLPRDAHVLGSLDHATRERVTCGKRVDSRPRRGKWTYDAYTRGGARIQWLNTWPQRHHANAELDGSVLSGRDHKFCGME